MLMCWCELYGYTIANGIRTELSVFINENRALFRQNSRKIDSLEVFVF